MWHKHRSSLDRVPSRNCPLPLSRNSRRSRAIRPLALGRKNHLFAGSDGGAEHWAVLASLIETCKPNGVDPEAYLADVITRIVQGHPQSDIDQLLPWNHAKGPATLAA